MKFLPALLRPAYHFLAYNLLYRSRLNRIVSTSLDGFEFVIRPSVMHPRIFKSGMIFARYLSSLDLRGKHVLDLGTGSGVLALAAAGRGARVTATDINPQAVQCASENIHRNGYVDVIRVLEGSLFDPVPGEIFDMIIFNPPYFDKRQNGSSDDPALYGGRNLSVIKEFARQAAAFLQSNGSLLVILSSDADLDQILKIFSDCKFAAHRVHQHQTFFEEFIVFKFTAVARREDILVCPSCRGALAETRVGWACRNESIFFDTHDGIPDFILPGRRPILDQFLSTYQSVRRKENWGSKDPRYYRELPFRDLSNEHSDVWAIRAKSYDCLIKHLMREDCSEPQRILDLGAGNCWLSLRLARLGYNVTAVDVNTDFQDGLGVVRRLADIGLPAFKLFRAEFNFLPFAERSFDAIIFNASLHYAKDPCETVKNIMPLLKQKGCLYVLDSPIFENEEHGEEMVKERIESFSADEKETVTEEFAGSFLTWPGLDRLRSIYVVDVFFPSYGFVWNLRPFLARLRGRRPPARFALIRIQNRNSME